MLITFTLVGRPVPQGSMVASYNRKEKVSHVHHVQGSALAMWRASIRLAAQEVGCTPTALPVRLSIQFGMPRPKAQMHLRRGVYVPKTQYIGLRPASTPDIDKLIRAVADALTNVAYHDDCQIVEIMASKVYGIATFVEITDEGLTPQQEAFSSLSSGLGINQKADTSEG